MVKKYFIIALICLVLLMGLFYFSDVFKKDFTGKVTYTIPTDGKLLNVVSNNIPVYFCESENKFYGNFNFKVREGAYLPADGIYVGALIYNKSSDNQFDYVNYETISLRNFMANTNPSIGEPVILSTTISGILGGTLSIGSGSIEIYNSTDPVILDNIYTFDAGMYNLDLPLEGDYNYILNFSEKADGGGVSLPILDGGFSVINKNCTLGLNNLNLEIVGGGSFYNGRSVNCSANVDGRFFDDLAKSQDKIRFSLEWYDGSNFLSYKNLVSGDSGISCSSNFCSGIFSVSESHINKWRCIINVSNGNSIIKYSNNLTMINSPPISTIIPNMSFSGGFEEDFIDLNNYFSDKDSNSLSYSKSGGSKINLLINSNGKANITAPYNYSLEEGFVISANDGINTTSSNLFYIRISEESLDNTTGNATGDLSCVSNWSIGEWSACDPSGVRTRIVFDENNCNIDAGKPAESESCTYTSTDTLTTPPTISQPKETKEGISIFKNKFLLSGIILGLFLLLLAVLLLIDRIRKKGKLFENKPKEKLETPKGEYKPKTENIPVQHVSEELNLVNLNEIVRYVKDMLSKGGDINSIKDKLINSGWKKENIEEAINFVRLKDYIDSMLNKGESKEKIIRLLKEKGWKEDFINKAFKE